jgi:4,5-dihydroxyphthalate decarboxylase
MVARRERALVPAPLTLSAALMPNDRTRALIDGSLAPDGITLHATAIHASEMFWRQLKFAEFDISEMSISSYTIATSKGPTDWVGIPVFTMRRFFHSHILVRSDAGIETPADLAGKRVAVPEYQQTGAVWCRGVLSDEFGVDPKTIDWYMERPPEQSHGGATGFVPPAGIQMQYIPTSTNIGEMLLAGSLDATLMYIPDNNLIDRSRVDLSGSTKVRSLFPNPDAESHRYFAKSGIYPINHCVVVRRSLLEKEPWIARSLYDAFLTAKTNLAKRRASLLGPVADTGVLSPVAKEASERDVMAYGLAATRNVLETVTRFVYEQGLSERRVGLEELFAASTLDL